MQPEPAVLRIQPDEGISLRFAAKMPGAADADPLGRLMDFLYGASFWPSPPEAYERLLLDAMRGDATLFTRSDEVEAQWRVCDPILQAWRELPRRLPTYPAGSQGPPEANAILRPGDAWRRI